MLQCQSKLLLILNPLQLSLALLLAHHLVQGVNEKAYIDYVIIHLYTKIKLVTKTISNFSTKYTKLGKKYTITNTKFEGKIGKYITNTKIEVTAVENYN